MNESTNSRIGDAYPNPYLESFKIKFYNPNALFGEHSVGYRIVRAISEQVARARFENVFRNVIVTSVEKEVQHG